MSSSVRPCLFSVLIFFALTLTPCPSFCDEVFGSEKDRSVKQASEQDAVSAEAPEGQSPSAGVTATTKESEASADRVQREDGKEDGFMSSVALIRHLVHDTDLPAMQRSLGLVSFVGELESIYPGEDAYAILPLGHDAVLEIYDLHYPTRRKASPFRAGI